MAGDTYNFSIFGLKLLDENGHIRNTPDQGGHTYFRNMVLEFIARHHPRTLVKYFPEIRGPWQWGKCADTPAFKAFCAEHFELRYNDDDGSVSIMTIKAIEEMVFHPNKFKRAEIRNISAAEDE